MMNDSRIVAHLLRNAVKALTMPRNRRELAAELRRIRNVAGKKAARFLLADLSRRCLDAVR